MKTAFSRFGGAIVCAAIAAALLSPANAGADAFFYHFDQVFSGTSPAGASPWINALFQDVTPGTVNLTVSAAGLTGTEFVSELYLNLNPQLTAPSLNFTRTGGSGSFSNPTISTGVDQFKADGDGKYDILFSFGTANGTTFTVGDSITFQITGIAGLHASDFEFLSAPAGGSGPFLAASHVQSIGNGDSGWIAPTLLTPVPEPGSATLLGSALVLFVGTRIFWKRTRTVS